MIHQSHFHLPRLQPAQNDLGQEVEKWKARCSVLEAEIEEFKEREAVKFENVDFAYKIAFALTTSEWLIFSLLMKREHVGYAAVMQELYSARVADAAEENIVKVFVCKLRTKLKKYGIFIETIMGQGYYIKPAMKLKINEMVNNIREVTG